MRLFIFEGKTREVNIHKTINRLFLKDSNIVCSFCDNIYTLIQGDGGF